MSGSDTSSSGLRRPGVRSVFRRRPLDERLRALKERVYASFTGLAIVTVLALDPSHAAASAAFSTLFVGIVGITIAGLVAEIVSDVIGHGRVPGRAELAIMMRIAAGAIVSASVPLVALLAAGAGLMGLPVALQISVGIYLLTLVVIALVAASRSRLPFRHQVLAFGGLVGLGAAAVGVLVLAH